MGHLCVLCRNLLLQGSSRHRRIHSRVDILLPTVLDHHARAQTNLQGIRRKHTFRTLKAPYKIKHIEDANACLHTIQTRSAKEFESIPCSAVMTSVSASHVWCRAPIEEGMVPVGVSPGHPRGMGEESD